MSSQAVGEIAGIKPDLVLLDFMLPFGLGTELCVAIKNHPVTRNIPVILHSASANLKMFAEGCHADAYLEKPFELNKLVELVNQSVR